MISVECKTDLEVKHLSQKARREIERDAVEKANLKNVLQPETMCGLTTDGVLWQFHFFSWKMKILLMNAEFEREDSPILSLDTDNDLEMIAEWLVFALKRSLETPNKFDLQVDTPMGKATMTKCFLSSSESLRPKIFKASKNGHHMEFKFFDFSESEISEDVHQKFADRLMMERKYLEEFDSVPSFVSLANITVNHDQSEAEVFEKYVLCMEDAGSALGTVSGSAGQHLAKIVYRDIWQGALSELKRRNLCFADIHPGNICVKGDSARLVDLESIKQVGESLDKSPILLRNNAPQSAEFDWDEASVAAILRCLWDDGDFKKLGDYAGTFKNTEDRKAFMTRLENDFAKDLKTSNSQT